MVVSPTTDDQVLIAATVLQYSVPTSQSNLSNIISIIKGELTKPVEGIPSNLSAPGVKHFQSIAKSIIALNQLDIETIPSKLLKQAEEELAAVATTLAESLDLATNCLFLNAILHSKELAGYISQVEKLSTVLIDAWLGTDVFRGSSESNFSQEDTSEFYSILSLSEALVHLLKVWGDGSYQSLPDDLIKTKTPLVLFQVLMYILQHQNVDGLWGTEPSPELSAYAILTLVNLSSIGFVGGLKPHINIAITKGRSYISSLETAIDIKRNGLEISKAYTLTALKTEFPRYTFSPTVDALGQIDQNGLKRYSFFFSKLACTQNIPLWRIQGCITEAYLFLPLLKRQRIDMFDRIGMKDDGYLDFIAMTFTCANNLQPFRISPNILLDMMILTLRAYQIDEYVEHVIAKDFGNNTEEVKSIIRCIFEDNFDTTILPESQPSWIGHSRSGINRIDEQKVYKLSQVREKLQAFVHRVLLHPAVTSSSSYNQTLLKNELREYLLAHISQIHDSEQYYTKDVVPYGSYHTWVRNTGASHVFVTFSLSYLECLTLTSSDATHARTAEEQYLIQDIWTHLGKKVRMENDRPSLLRDREERNLNSLDFPEFKSAGEGALGDAMEQITRIILYEKRRCELAFEVLEQVAGRSSRAVEILRFYSFLTDVCGDVYALRDISTNA